jgi:ribosomal protein L40E
MHDADDELVTIDRFLFVNDAELARATLDAHDVDAVLADNIVRMSWGDAQAHGGVRLQVRRRDAAEALAILRDEHARGVELDHGDVAPPRGEVCRRCGSEEIFPIESRAKVFSRAILVMFAGLVAARLAPTPAFSQGIILAAVLTPVVAMFVAVVASRKRCRNCNAEWRGTQRTA